MTNQASGRGRRLLSRGRQLGGTGPSRQTPSPRELDRAVARRDVNELGGVQYLQRSANRRRAANRIAPADSNSRRASSRETL